MNYQPELQQKLLIGLSNMGSSNLNNVGIYYHIVPIAEASSWYHRQFENENDSYLFTLKGNSILESVSASFDVKVDDNLYVYMVNKVYNLNAYCHTKSHIMICKNFDLLDEFDKLSDNDYTFNDLYNIELEKNNDDDVNENKGIIHHIIPNMDNYIKKNFLIINMLNYEINIYKYLSSLSWIGMEFTDITVFDLYENDVTINTINIVNYKK